jgi:hypothetical protein
MAVEAEEQVHEKLKKEVKPRHKLKNWVWIAGWAKKGVGNAIEYLEKEIDKLGEIINDIRDLKGFKGIRQELINRYKT